MKTITTTATRKLRWKLGIPLAILILFILALLFSSSKVIVPEDIQHLDLSSNDSSNYLSEDDYEKQMSTVVEPYLDTLVTSEYFTAHDSARIYYLFIN